MVLKAEFMCKDGIKESWGGNTGSSARVCVCVCGFFYGKEKKYNIYNNNIQQRVYCRSRSRDEASHIIELRTSKGPTSEPCF